MRPLVRPKMLCSRKLLIAACVLVSPATLAGIPQSFPMTQKAEMCRDLDFYLQVAKHVASRDVNLFSAFLEAKPNAYECFILHQGGVIGPVD
jgi:hypothetical protein